MVNEDDRDRVKNVHKALKHMQKPVLVVLVFALLVSVAIPHASVNVLAQQHYKTNVNTGQDLAIDSFESLNATERSFVTSMDTYGSQMVGCAEFSGSLQNNMGSNSIQSAGGKDVLLFGWDSTQGYWQQAFGSQDDDFCWKVRWISQDMVGVSGYFKDGFTVGAHQLVTKETETPSLFNSTPHHRRLILPSLLAHQDLKKCEVSSLYRMVPLQ